MVKQTVESLDARRDGDGMTGATGRGRAGDKPDVGGGDRLPALAGVEVDELLGVVRLALRGELAEPLGDLCGVV